MRLRLLEIKGFKSFANQTIINFDENITGIVGPNGSGKSNLVDAIRWVLGEQKTKELRTEKMENVIFNGTKTSARSGRAFVRLLFSNEDKKIAVEYNEIDVSRTLYRSGESEYRLNGVKCRLKDIRDLFMDSGVGSNSYAIISLGMVDEILLDRENFRRRMIEQAASIEKFRYRKKKTVSKLSKTQEDLERLEDLLHEVKKNMNSLKIQASRAKKHHEIKADYKRYSLLLAKEKIENSKNNLLKKEEFQKNIESQQRSLVTKKNDLESRIEKVKLEIVQEEKKISLKNNVLNKLLGEIRDLENTLNLSKERVKNSTEGISNSEKRKEESSKRIEELSQQREKTEISKKNIQNKLDGLKQEMDTLQSAKMEGKKALDEAEKSKREYDEFVRGNESKRREQKLKLGLLEAKIQSTSSTLSQLLANLAGFEQKKIEVDSILIKDTKMYHELQKKEEAVDEKKKAIELELRNSRDGLKAEEKKSSDKGKQLSRLESEIDLTEGMINSLEGFPESVKLLRKNKSISKELKLLSDLIEIDEEYKVGLELFLNQKLNTLVSPSPKVANQAIELLVKEQKGRVEIMLTKDIKEPSLINHELSGLIHAVDLVKFKSADKALVLQLLTNVYFLEKIDADQNIPKGITLVEISGQRMFNGSTLRGGSVNLFTGKKLGRQSNLELLKRSHEKLKEEIRTIDLDIEKRKSGLTDLEHELSQINFNDIRTKRENLGRSIASLEQQKTNLEAQISSALTAKDENNTVVKQSKTELKSLTNLLAQDNIGEEGLMEELEKRNGILAQTKLKYDQEAQAFNSKNIEFIQAQNQVANVNRELEISARDLDRETNRLNELNASIKQNTDIVNTLTKTIKKTDENLQSLYIKRQSESERLNAEESGYFKAKELLNNLEIELRKILASTRDFDSKHHENLRNIQDFRYKIEEQQNILLVEFGENVLKELELTELDPEASNIIELRDKAKNLLVRYGEINPLAIEAYEEVKIRYEMLTSQVSDIREAKETLLNTISEIEEEANHRFKVTFEAVRENFKKVFRELFTQDDECDLYLEDENESLNSKIKIMARPKGKRPQSINQLSGGEKTLTSTAFLFALYLLKPAPFCVFDEVDAPLDDHNIVKFNRIISKFSKDSQFIIITHNKLTMSSVDIIYGITMGKQGISQVSGVDFRELKNPAITTSI